MVTYYDNENSLVHLIDKINNITIFTNNKQTEINENIEKFHQIKNRLNKLFSDAILMPAFSVSLHNETIEEMKSGIWLKLNFLDEQTKNGLPFSSLVFKLENISGFNLIREYNKSYSGRCLYLHLDEEINLLDLISD